MTKRYYKLPRHPSEMTDQELRGHLAHIPNSQVVRSLLIAEVEAIRAGADREMRTLRGLWYSLVKPALSRAGILDKLTKKGKPTNWAADLSRYLGELVRIGETTYEELRIIDGSRSRQTATTVAQTIIDVDLVGAHFPWVILFTEKDTIWGAVRNLASLYGVSAISGGGEPSYACTENTIRAIMRSTTFQEARPERIVLLTLTDYDPFGYTISDAQYTQIAEAVESMGDECFLPAVAKIRIGLEPDQLTQLERNTNAYTPKDRCFDEWYAETGGVDGQPLGLELDALPLSRVRGMFADAIAQHVDLDRRRDDLRAAYVDLLACELLLPEFNKKRRKLRAAIRADDLGQVIATTPIPDELFRAFAKEGWPSIDPVTDYDPFGCADQVREVMTAAL